MSEAASMPVTNQMIKTIDTRGTIETEMLHALSGILFRGTYGIVEVEAIQAVASNDTFDTGARKFAQNILKWLMRNSTRAACH